MALNKKDVADLRLPLSELLFCYPNDVRAPFNLERGQTGLKDPWQEEPNILKKKHDAYKATSPTRDQFNIKVESGMSILLGKPEVPLFTFWVIQISATDFYFFLSHWIL